MRTTTLVLMFSVAAGCGSESARPAPGDSADDQLCVDADGAEAAGVLAMVNDPKTTLDDLDRSVAAGGAGLDRRAAEGLIAGRPFDSIAEIDSVRFVGNSACKALVTFACAVQNRCADVCTTELEQPPADTTFDDQCAAMLVDLIGRERGASSELGEVPPAERCDLVSDTARRAYAFAAREFGSTPEEIEEVLVGFDVSTLELADGAGAVDIVDMSDIDAGTRFVVGFAGDTPLFLYVNDGLGGIAHWYCGATPGLSNLDNDDCLEDIIDTACEPGSGQPFTFTVNAQEAAALDDPLHAAADNYRAAHDLAATVDMTIVGELCGDGQDILSRGSITVSSPGVTPTLYQVADIDAGAELLSAREGDGAPQLLCDVVEF